MVIEILAIALVNLAMGFAIALALGVRHRRLTGTLVEPPDSGGDDPLMNIPQ